MFFKRNLGYTAVPTDAPAGQPMEPMAAQPEAPTAPCAPKAYKRTDMKYSFLVTREMAARLGVAPTPAATPASEPVAIASNSPATSAAAPEPAAAEEPIYVDYGTIVESGDKEANDMALAVLEKLSTHVAKISTALRTHKPPGMAVIYYIDPPSDAHADRYLNVIVYHMITPKSYLYVLENIAARKIGSAHVSWISGPALTGTLTFESYMAHYMDAHKLYQYTTRGTRYCVIAGNTHRGKKPVGVWVRRRYANYAMMAQRTST